MRLDMRSTAAVRLARELYSGDSPPISVVNPWDEPLVVEWWLSNPQGESSRSDRHFAGLALYLEVAKSSKISLPPDSFPARMDFDDKSMRPDKGVMKVLLDEGLVTPCDLGAQLIFALTPAGSEYRAARAAVELRLPG